jgi:hypothetical protein
MSVKAMAISIAVILIISLLPEVYNFISDRRQGRELSVYTVKALNIETGVEVYIGDYRELLESYVMSFGKGLVDSGDVFWDEEITYAPFQSIQVDDFRVGSRAEIIQRQLVSLIVEGIELSSILNVEWQEFKTFSELQGRLLELQEQVWVEVREIPEDMILSLPKDLGYYAKVSHQMVGQGDLGVEDIYIHSLGGIQEIASWAFDNKTSVGESGIVESSVGVHQVTLKGYVSEETLERYLGSLVTEGLGRVYRERLGKWILLE